MHHRRARVLVVDNVEGSLSSRLAEGFALHDVEFTRDRLDAIRRIDCATAFVQCVPNLCVDLPIDAEALDSLVNRRTAHRGSALARREPHGECSSARPEAKECA